MLICFSNDNSTFFLEFKVVRKDGSQSFPQQAALLSECEFGSWLFVRDEDIPFP